MQLIRFTSAVLLLAAIASARVHPCEKRPVVGPCKAKIPKWYFSQKTHTCTKFFWGGCAGVVPFQTLLSCKKARCGALKRRCTLKPATGPCRAAITRYFYNKRAKACKKFTWGGCFGVVPFLSLRQCKKARCSRK